MESALVRIGLEFCKRKGKNKVLLPYKRLCYYSSNGRAKMAKAAGKDLESARDSLTARHRDLALDCSKYERDFANLISPGKVLDTYYIPTRYPNGLVGNEIPSEYYSGEDAHQCISYAESILQIVKRFMSS